MLKILTVIGTRPEAIKMAPVLRELRRHPDAVRPLVCSVGQHREMLDQVFDLFRIVPDYELGVMRSNQTLAGLTGQLFTSLDPVIDRVRPDWILAQGDTTTVFVAAMLGLYHRVAFGHVEAGLRTHDLQHPFPEEANRRIADILAAAWFAPTEHARRTLLAEGCPLEHVHVTGNTGIDALLDIAARDYDWSQGPLAALPCDRPLVLVTAHRREVLGAPFLELCRAIRELAQSPEGCHTHFVYPVHLNPRVQHPVRHVLGNLPNVSLIQPLDYASLVQLMKRSVLVLTDSGGIQEEAPSLGVPVFVMRETTERPEGLAGGLARLVGTRRERIVSEVREHLRRPATHHHRDNVYGDGHAAQRIVSVLLRHQVAPPTLGDRKGQEALIT